MYIHIYTYIYGGVRHCGCKGLHPLGLTRAIVRASLMHEGFPQSLFNVVCNGTTALTGELMSRCAARGFTEKMGSAMVRAALMHVWHYIYVYVTKCLGHVNLEPVQLEPRPSSHGVAEHVGQN